MEYLSSLQLVHGKTIGRDKKVYEHLTKSRFKDDVINQRWLFVDDYTYKSVKHNEEHLKEEVYD